MNFFPNLSIHFHLSSDTPDHETRRQPPMRTTSTRSSDPRMPGQGSNAIGHFIQRFLRSFEHQTTDDGTSGDVHFYVNLETLGENNDATDTTTGGLTIEQIHQATTLGVHRDEAQICAICHQSIETSSVSQTIVVCGHSFHPVCVERWLVRNNSCPVCRAHV